LLMASPLGTRRALHGRQAVSLARQLNRASRDFIN
jgi:hypothetical protein